MILLWWFCPCPHADILYSQGRLQDRRGVLQLSRSSYPLERRKYTCFFEYKVLGVPVRISKVFAHLEMFWNGVSSYLQA